MYMNNEYTEPVGFKGTKGQWVMAGINWGIAIKERSLAERGFSDRIAELYSTSSENTYNAQLMMHSKELLKALQMCEPYMHDLQKENTGETNVGLYYDYDLEKAYSFLKEVLNKALNYE